MTIKVEFKSALKDVTGISATTIDKSFNTFEKAMHELLRQFPGLKDEMFYSNGSIDYVYQIYHNGKRLTWPDDKDVRLKEGDDLVFLIFMAGG